MRSKPNGRAKHKGEEFSKTFNNSTNKREGWKFQQDTLERDKDEPEWLDTLEESEVPGASFQESTTGSHSVEEFEAWKAKMKAEEFKQAGLEVPEYLSTKIMSSPEEFSKEDMLSSSVASDKEGVDRIFGMWSSSHPNTAPKAINVGKSNDEAEVLSTSASSSSLPPGASKFSRFFSADTPKQHQQQQQQHHHHHHHQYHHRQQQQQQEQQEQEQSNDNSPSSANANIHSDGDKEGFQRIMRMLGNKHEAESDTNQDPTHSPKTDGNNVFFMSLLNKSTEREKTPRQSKEGSESSPSSVKSIPSPPQARQLPPPPPGWFVNADGNHKPIPTNFPPGFFPPPPPPPGFDSSQFPPMPFPPPPPPPGFHQMMMESGKFPPLPPNFDPSRFPPPPPIDADGNLIFPYPPPPPPPPPPSSSGSMKEKR